MSLDSAPDASGVDASSAVFASAAAVSSASAAGGASASPLWQSALVQRVLSLPAWSSPLHSSLTLLCALLVTALLHSGYTVLTLVSYLLLLQLLTCFLFINGSQLILKMKGQAVEQQQQAQQAASAHAEGVQAKEEEGHKEFVSLESVQNLVPLVHAQINRALNRCMSIIRCVNNARTLRVMAALFVASLVGRVFDGVQLFGLALILAMSVPKLYTANQVVVDKKIDTAKRIVEQLWSLMRTKAPGAVKAKNA